MVNVPTSLNILKTKDDEFDTGEVKAVVVGLQKASHIVDKNYVKNTKFNKLKTKVNNLEKKILESITLIQTQIRKCR